MNGHGHTLWWLLTGACLFWYSFITLFVAWRGLGDIRRMLRGLKGPEPIPGSERPEG